MDKSEIWKPVQEYEGMYEVSNLGRVRSLDRVDCVGNRRKGRVLRSSTVQGYPFVNLSKNSQQFVVRVHALVAEAFIGKRPEGYTVNHKDGDKKNNRVENLEYMTQADNNRHAAEMGLYGTLSVEQVRAIRFIFTTNPRLPTQAVADKLGVQQATVKGVLTGYRYSSIPNEDGTAFVPIKRPKLIEDIDAMTTLGFTLPEVSQYLHLENSTPYQALRRAALQQE